MKQSPFQSRAREFKWYAWFAGELRESVGENRKSFSASGKMRSALMGPHSGEGM
jgi:hypothetical protein